MEKKVIRKIDFEQRKLIEKYLKKGFSCSKISKLISRSKNCVVTEVRKNEGKDKYDAEKAQKISEFNRKEKYQKLSERNRNQKIISPLEKRVRSLEMQIEILHETINDLRKK